MGAWVEATCKDCGETFYYRLGMGEETRPHQPPQQCSACAQRQNDAAPSAKEA